MDTRIALVGNNGIGKTTFLNLILKKLEPLTGTIRHEKAMKYA